MGINTPGQQVNQQRGQYQSGPQEPLARPNMPSGMVPSVIPQGNGGVPEPLTSIRPQGGGIPEPLTPVQQPQGGMVPEPLTSIRPQGGGVPEPLTPIQPQGFQSGPQEPLMPIRPQTGGVPEPLTPIQFGNQSAGFGPYGAPNYAMGGAMKPNGMPQGGQQIK